MNTIKGLMLKDLYVFKNYKKNIYFSIIVFAFIIAMASVRINVLVYGSIIFLFFFGMNSISTFSYDENSEIDKYLLSLPITRKEIVFSKYLFTFLNSFLSLIFGFILSLIISLLVTHEINSFFNSLKICFLAFTSVSFLMCADIPCIYKWGVEKGRMQSVLVPILIFFLLSFLSFIILLIFPNLYNLITLDKLLRIAPILCLILNIFFYYLSFHISYKIFSKKSI